MHAPDPAQLLARLAATPGAAGLRDAVRAGDPPVYLVGGAVRDLALGRMPRDLDVAVDGPLAQLAARLGRLEAGHSRFGTATVRGVDGARYDLARTRRETYAAPGALPDVAPAGIEADLRRRDFTVSALALGLNGPRAGELVAAPDAIDDLAARRLRVLHPASFRDDPTRLLRVGRYAGRLGFDVEPSTAALARAAIAAGALQTVSGERIGTELTLLAGEADPAAGFAWLGRLGIDAAIAPGFGVGDPDVLRRALALLSGPPPAAAALALAAALLEVAPAAREPLLQRLGIERRTRRVALAAAAQAPELARRIPPEGPPSGLLDVLAPDAPVTWALGGGLGSAAVRARLQRWFTVDSKIRPAIDGDALVAAGVAPGPAVATGLRAALAARLDGQAPDRTAQLAVALRAARAAAGG